MQIRTFIQTIKQIQLIVQHSSVLLCVCELSINSAFAHPSKQFDANRSPVLILLHLLASVVYHNTRTHSLIYDYYQFQLHILVCASFQNAQEYSTQFVTQLQVAQAQYVSVIISTHNVQEFNSNQIYGAQLIIRRELRFNRQYEKHFCRLKLLTIGNTFLHYTHLSCLVVFYDFTALKQLYEKQSLKSKILCTGDWVISLWATHSTL